MIGEADRESEQVSSALVTQLAGDRYLGKLREVGASELRNIVDQVLASYSAWADGCESKLTACSDFIGNMCFGLSVPVVEAAYALYVLRDGLLAILSTDRAARQGDSCQQATRFFDLLVLQLLRQY